MVLCMYCNQKLLKCTKKCILLNPLNDNELQPPSVHFCTRELDTHAKEKKNPN